MTPFMILNNLAEFITEKLQQYEYKLRPAPFDTAMNQDGPSPDEATAEPVIPGVFIGNIPHSNFVTTMPDQFFRAPYVLVGMEEAVDDNGTGSIGILIQVCVYSEVDQSSAGPEGIKVPDNQGVLDALNLLQFISDKLTQQWVFEGTAMRKPIRMGMYTAQAMTWPFAFGYLAFDAELMDTAPTNIIYGE